MTNPPTIAVIVGSLRKASWSRKLALALIELGKADLAMSIVEIGALSHYDEDEEAAPPAAWTAFRDSVRPADGVLFITPEYNRSVPGLLKNAIDVGSRPYGKSVWSGKPAAIISNSPGAVGGFGANHHLRQSLVFLDMPTLQQPEAYVGHVNTLFGEDGGIAVEGTRTFLAGFLSKYAAWVKRNGAA
jgi:chromate reductase